jgi:ABC-type branched-subunit amino acid transport system ATPase component
MTAPALLSMEGLTKRFGGVTALQDVSFAVRPGTIHGLIGPNGSGKTTNFNVISGMYRPDGGKIIFDGVTISGMPAHRITRSGIARTFQNLRLFKTMSVLDNVLVGLGGSPRGRDTIFPWDPYLRPWRAHAADTHMRAEAMALLDRFQLTDLADVPATSLPYGKQRRVEIARALATQPRLLLLDEPAAGLNAEETHELEETFTRLVAEGLTILMIEHDMRLVMGVCQWVTVLDQGKLIADGTPDMVRSNEQVLAAYLGREED